MKIAVIGLITPWIPNWLPSQFWTGMQFEDMVASAKKWIKVVQEKENADVVVGLFHSGVDFTYGGANADTPNNENAAELVASRVPGFDLIFTGHDHAANNKVVKDPNGKPVTVVGGQNAARNVAIATVTLTKNAAGAWDKAIETQIKPLAGITIDMKFTTKFAPQFREVRAWVSRPIGKMAGKISTRDSMFGDSAFVDLIHNVQLVAGGEAGVRAEQGGDLVRRAARDGRGIPSSSDGTLYVRDMFNLYVYENFLYTMT